MVYVFIIKMLKRIAVLIKSKIINLWIPAIMNYDSPFSGTNHESSLSKKVTLDMIHCLCEVPLDTIQWRAVAKRLGIASDF